MFSTLYNLNDWPKDLYWEMRHWLEENVGPLSHKYEILGIKFCRTWDWYGHTVMFWHKEDATAFRLKFGV